MPAVNPTRLKFQLEALLSNFVSPQEFHRQLQDLFNLYANRALRFGESSPTMPLLPMYNPPQPVLRQLLLSLIPYIKEHPVNALNLADELWNDDYFEIKQIAISILGIVPSKNPEAILDRIEEWLSPDLDMDLKKEILSSGLVEIQSTFPEVWESFIKSLLSQKGPEWVSLGILGLTEGVKNPTYKNLPVIFRLISPLIQDPLSKHERTLTKLIEAIADRSPTETTFFLKQALSITRSQETTRLVKGCLSAFPEDLRQSLKDSLKK